MYLDMKKRGIVPSMDTFKLLLNACDKKGSLRAQARRLGGKGGKYEEEEEEGEREDGRGGGQMEHEDTETARHILIEMLTLGMTVEKSMISFFISMCLQKAMRLPHSRFKGDQDDDTRRANPSAPAISLLKYLEKHGWELADSHVQEMDALCCAAKNVAGGRYLISLMKERGLQPSHALRSLAE